MVHLKRQIALLKGRLKRFENIERREAKHKRKRHHSSSMPRHKGGRVRTVYRHIRHRAGRARRGLGGIKGGFRTGAMGIGGGELGGYVGNLAMGPTGMMIGQLGGAYLAGGVKGLVIDQIYRSITGRGGILQGIFGGGGLGGLFGGGSPASAVASL